MFTFREKMILNELYNKVKYEKISNLAETCNVTSRTIINDLENIKSKLLKTKVELITKSGVGICLIVEESAKSEFEKTISITKEMTSPVLPEDRVLWIVKNLLDTDKLMTFDEIAENLYVSKSTVVNDFDKVEKYVQKFGASLFKKQKHGTKLIADEKTTRIIKADILKNLTSKHEDVIDDELRNILQGIDLDAIKQILINTEEEFKYLLSDISFKGLLIHIAISLKRLTQGNVMKMDDEEINLLKKQYEWKIAEAISKKIGIVFKIDLCIPEIAYITIHLACAKLQNDIETQKFDFNYLNKLDSFLFEKLQKSIEEITLDTGYDFIDDKKLFIALFLHLRPAINRARNRINLDNPFLGDIKKEYSVAYEIAVLTYHKLEKIYNVKVSDEEIGYAALHFATSLERLKSRTKKKVILICATGIGTSQLLFTKFIREFPDVEVMDILSSFNAAKIADDLSPDLILSTVPFKSKSIPVINVSPLLTKEDSENIRKVIYSKGKVAEKILTDEHILKSYIDDKCIFLNEKQNSKEKIIKLMSDKLMTCGYVKEGFFNSVLEREKFSSTSVGNYMAIPHSYEGFVNLSKIAVAVLKSPIKWGENKVQIVFMIALDISEKKAFKKIFEELNDFINDKEIICKLKNCKNIEEFTKIFKY